MKKIGIVIAVLRELKSFLESDFKIEEVKLRNFTIYKTNINGNEIYAIQSGMGMVDATLATHILIEHFDCEIIINYGVTGALDRTVKVKELFIVNKAVNSGLDTSPIDPIKKCQYGDLEDIYIPLDEDLAKLALEIDPTANLAICASSDRFIEDKKLKEEIKKDTTANICDMECAAIARTCYLNQVKCLSIKCISDAYDGDGSDFAINIVESGKKAFDLLKKILYRL